MRPRKKAVIFLAIVAIPSLLLLYFQAEWPIWQILILVAIQIAISAYALRKRDEEEKKNGTKSGVTAS